MYLKSGVFVIIIHEQTFLKNICKDVKESCGFSRRTETIVGIQAHESIIIYHVSKWDGSNREKAFRNWEARDSNLVSKINL